MMGSYIKKLWKNWPEEETPIMAEDLNRYEESLEEHDQGLAEQAAILEAHAEEIAAIQMTNSSISSRVESNTDNINELNQQIENLNHAGNMADNSVLVAEEEKIVGSIGGYNIYQKGYVRYIQAGNSGGVEYFNPFESSQIFNGIITDVKAVVSENGHNLFASDSVSSIENGHVNVSYNNIYNLIVTYDGLDSALDKVMFVRVRYIKLKVVDFTYQGRCRIESGALIAELTGQTPGQIYANVGDIYKLTSIQSLSTQSIRSAVRFDVMANDVVTLGDRLRWNDDSPVNIDDVIYVRIERVDGVPVPKVYRNMESLYR